MMIIRQLLAAVSFLTRVPLPLFAVSDSQSGARLSLAVWAFPLVGMLVGGAGAGVLLAADLAGLPVPLSVMLAVGTGVIMTGALHEDGLADFCDGLGVSGRARILAVMRDSQSGSFGVLGLVASAGWRVAALVAIASAGGGAAALAFFLMHSGARGVMGMLMLLPLADKAGLAHGARDGGGMPFISVAAGLVIVAGVFGWLLPAAVAAAALMVAMIAAGLIALIARRRLGGMTGDVYGAAEQAAEMGIVGVLATVAI